MELAIVIAVVVVALVFDYTNGFHDAANAIATSVSTRALTPRIALILAAVMNFVGALLGQEVAHTVSEMIDATRRQPRAGDRAGRPVGRDHLEPDHLVLRAALVVLARPDRRPGRRGPRRPGAVVHWKTIVDKVVIPMVLSPLFGFAPRSGDARRSCGSSGGATRTGSTAASGCCRPSRPPPWRSATGSRTPRRRWA